MSALVAASRGHEADTIKSLESAYAHGFRDRWVMANDPRLALVRDDPAYRALLEKLSRDIAAQRTQVDRSGQFSPAAR